MFENLKNLATKMDDAVSMSVGRLLLCIPGLNKFDPKEASSLFARICITIAFIRLFFVMISGFEVCSVACKCQEFLSAWACFTLMSRVAEGTGLSAAGSIGVYVRLALVGSMLASMHSFGNSLSNFYMDGWQHFNFGRFNLMFIVFIAPVLTVASLYLVDSNEQPNKKNRKTLSQRLMSWLFPQPAYAYANSR
jgi:hypothetical protein